MRNPLVMQNEHKVHFIKRLIRKNQTNKQLILDLGVFPKQELINQVNADLSKTTDELIAKNLNRLVIDLQALPGDAGTLVKAWMARHPDDKNYQAPHTLSNANLDDLIVDLILRGCDVDLNNDVASIYNTVIFAYNTYPDTRVYSIEPHKCPLHLAFAPTEKLTNDSLMTFEKNGFSGQYPLAEIRFINDNIDHDELIHDYHIQRGLQNLQTQPYQELQLLNLI